MKVVLVIASLGVGGTEQKVIRLANYLIEVGRDVEVISLSKNNPHQEMLNRNISFKEFETTTSLIKRINGGRQFKNYLLNKKLKSEQFTVFYFNYYPALFISKKITRQVVFINTTHLVGVVSRVKQYLALLKMKSANVIVVGNQFLKQYLQKKSSLKDSRINVLQNGIETNCEKKESYSIDENVFRLVIVAQLRPEKRHLDIFRTIKILKEKGFNIELDCIGAEVLPFQEQTLKRAAASLGVADNVRFKGAVQNVRALLPNYGCFVLPSNDTFSNALLEAMAAGLPVVGADIGGSPEIITNYSDGLLYKFSDTTMLADCIHELILNESLRKKLGVNAVNKVHMKFSSKIMYKKYEGYIDEQYC